MQDWLPYVLKNRDSPDLWVGGIAFTNVTECPAPRGLSSCLKENHRNPKYQSCFNSPLARPPHFLFHLQSKEIEEGLIGKAGATRVSWPIWHKICWPLLVSSVVWPYMNHGHHSWFCINNLLAQILKCFGLTQLLSITVPHLDPRYATSLLVQLLCDVTSPLLKKTPPWDPEVLPSATE